MRIGRGALIRGLIGIAISLVAIVILLRSIDVAEVVDILRGASPAWIAVMVLATLVDIGARGGRWQALLAPIASRARTGGCSATRTSATSPTTSCRRGSASWSAAMPWARARASAGPPSLGTVVVERIVDTVMVVVDRGRQRAGAERPRRDEQRGPAGPRVRGSCSSSGWVSGWPPIGCPARTAWSRSSSDGRGSLELGRRLREGLRVAGRPRTLAAAIALSALAWAASIIDVPRRRPGRRHPADARAGCARRHRRRAGDDRALRAGLRRDVRADRRGDHRRRSASTDDTAVAMAVLVHATILVVTSVGGAIAAIRMRIGITTGAGDEIAPGRGRRCDRASPGWRASDIAEAGRTGEAG